MSNKLIHEWELANNMLAFYKKLEAELREAVVAELFKSNSAGTFHHDTPDGRDLICTKRDNYSLDPSATYELAPTIASTLGPELAAQLITWKPTLSVSVYKKLSPEHQDLLRDCLTIKPGMPTLELKVRK